MQFALLLLPLLTFIGLVWLLTGDSQELRWAILAGSVITGAFIVLLTEGLSLFAALGTGPVIGVWCLALATTAGLLARRGDRLPRLRWPPAHRQHSDRFLFALFGMGALICLVPTGVTAVVAVPNSWDAMVYHLPRVMHWIQNESVHHYPTHQLKQLYSPPLTEWLMLQVRLFTGSEHSFALVPWVAFALTPIAVSDVASELGASFRGQLLAAAFALTLPLALAQATSTLIDGVTAFWATTTVAFMLRLRHRSGGADLFLAATSIGLLMLTKYSGLLAVWPFILWAFISTLRRSRRAAEKFILVTAVVLLLVNGGHWLRNAQLFGDPLGPVESTGVVETNFDLDAVAANVLRNAAVLAAGPWPTWNHGVARATRAVAEALDIDLNPPGSAWRRIGFRLPKGGGVGESRAGAPFHLVLGAVALLLVVLAGRRFASGQIRIFALALVAAFLVHSAVLRWQPDQVRFLLPLLTLCGAGVGAVLASGESSRWTRPILFLLVVLAMGPAMYQAQRPLTGRHSIFLASRLDQLFVTRRHERTHFGRLIDHLRESGCRNIAIAEHGDGFEYPVWSLLRNQDGSYPRIRQMYMKNPSATLQSPRPAQPPCAVIHLFGGIQRDRLNLAAEPEGANS